MAALTSALAVTHTAGAFQTALDRRQCGGETSRGVVCVARASARAQSALAGVSRPGRVVFPRSWNAGGGGGGSARPRHRGTRSRATPARGAARRSDVTPPRPRVRETLPERYARLMRTETPPRDVRDPRDEPRIALERARFARVAAFFFSFSAGAAFDRARSRRDRVVSCTRLTRTPFPPNVSSFCWLRRRPRRRRARR